VIEGARWARLDELLDAALERLKDARRSFLESACGDDGELRQEVLRLLELAEADDRELSPGALAASEWDENTALGDAAGTNVPEPTRARRSRIHEHRLRLLHDPVEAVENFFCLLVHFAPRSELTVTCGHCLSSIETSSPQTAAAGQLFSKHLHAASKAAIA
jgi:hypothetical protein